MILERGQMAERFLDFTVLKTCGVIVLLQYASACFACFISVLLDARDTK